MSLTFPDNDKREKRAMEITTDINSSLAAIVSDEAEINRKTAQLNDLIDKAIKDLEPDALPQLKTLDLYGKAWFVADSLAGLFSFSVGYKILLKACGARLLSQAAARAAAEEGGVALGEMGEQVVVAAAEELAIPLTARCLSIAGGAVLAFGVEVLMDEIQGNKARSLLQHNIWSNFPLRTTQKRNELQVRKLLEHVNSILINWSEGPKLNPPMTPNQRDQMMAMAISSFKPELDKINKATAQKELDQLDQVRGSWTNEDRGT
jgi:hypothetical protein